MMIKIRIGCTHCQLYCKLAGSSVDWKQVHTWSTSNVSGFFFLTLVHLKSGPSYCIFPASAFFSVGSYQFIIRNFTINFKSMFKLIFFFFERDVLKMFLIVLKIFLITLKYP